MATISVQKVPKKHITAEKILFQFCYNFPQYTYEDARKLPYNRVIRMLKVAEQEKAKLLYNLTRAIAAPHGAKGSVKKLLDHFKSIID